MYTEKEKMLRGELYDASDMVLAEERTRARELMQLLNHSGPEQVALRQQVLKALLPFHGEDFWLEPPFYCDYGYNIRTGDRVFFNFNCTILDVMPVNIGSRVLCGPSVHIYTAMHPMNKVERAAGPEYAKPVTIGSDVWIGGGVIVCPGVTIGDGAVIGAGSVVTRDVAANVFAAGNPCRQVKPL